MTFEQFLATYSYDRLEFGDSTKYLYETIYEALEGKEIDLTPIDAISIKIFDEDIILDSGLITEEVSEKIKNGELQEVLKESAFLSKLGTFLGGKAKAEDLTYFKKYADQMTGLQPYQKEQWIQQMMNTNTGASKGLWTKLNSAFGNYNSGKTSAALAAKSAETMSAANAATAGAQLKAFLAKGASWLLNPANFSVIAGSVGGILALKLLLRFLKKRRLKREMRMELQEFLDGKNKEILSEEQNELFEKNLKEANELINKYKKFNRIENGITKQNTPLLNY